jgi:hypothetical protein
VNLQIDIRISPDTTDNGYGTLQMTESVRFQGNSFLEISSVLGKFHDMLSELKKEKVQCNKNQ